MDRHDEYAEKTQYQLTRLREAIEVCKALINNSHLLHYGEDVGTMELAIVVLEEQYEAIQQSGPSSGFVESPVIST